MIGERLLQARKAAGLSLRELAERVELSHTAISRFEKNQLKPSSGQLIQLGRALGVRGEFFFRPVRVMIQDVEYRKRSTLSQRLLDRVRGDVLEQAERWQELLNLYPTPPIPGFSSPAALPERIAPEAEIESVAECVREAWSLGRNPIPDLIDLLESRGIRVILTQVDADGKFDGLAGQVEGAPLVVVGSHWSGDRQRFTLAHELGHLMLKGRLAPAMLAKPEGARSDPEERGCNRFAGAFLLPKAALVERLGADRHTLEGKELLLLKHEFGMSMQACLFRARDTGILAEASFERLLRLFRVKGWHRKEPGSPYPPEQSLLLEQLVYRALAEGYIGESKAAELLGQPLAEFHRQRRLEDRGAAAH